MRREAETSRFVKAASSLVLAVVLWLVVFLFQFRPFNFWIMLSIATFILFSVAVFVDRPKPSLSVRPWHMILGIIAGVLLYGFFYAGFQFTKYYPIIGQGVGQVYDLRSSSPTLLIVLLIIFPISPSEEVYWRGLIQSAFAERFGAWPGFILASLAYSFVHLPTLNAPLILTALIGGFVWGFLYKRTNGLVPCIISHLIFDLLIFVVAPLT